MASSPLTTNFLEGRPTRVNRREEKIDRIKKVLIVRANKIRKTLGLDEASFDESDLSSTDLPSGADEAETAFAVIHEAEDRLNAERLSRELKQIEEAIRAIRENTYGICLGCGKPIPMVRLRALPYASCCVECQREDEKKWPDSYV